MKKLILMMLILATSVSATPIPHLFFEEGNVSLMPLILTIAILSIVSFYFISWMNNGSVIKESNLVIDACFAGALSVMLIYLLPLVEIVEYYFSINLMSLIFWVVVLIILVASLFGTKGNLRRDDKDWLKDEQTLYEGMELLKKEESQLNRYLMNRVNHLSPEQRKVFAQESKAPKLIAKVFEKRINKARKLSTPGEVSLGKIVRTAQVITGMIPTKEELIPYLSTHEGKQFLQSMADEVRELKRHVEEVKFLEDTHLEKLVKKIGVVQEGSSIQEKTELHFLVTRVNEKQKTIHSQMKTLLEDLEKQILNKKIAIEPDFLNLGEDLKEMNISVKELEAELSLVKREHFFHSLKHPIETLKRKFGKNRQKKQKSLNTKR